MPVTRPVLRNCSGDSFSLATSIIAFYYSIFKTKITGSPAAKLGLFKIRKSNQLVCSRNFQILMWLYRIDNWLCQFLLYLAKFPTSLQLLRYDFPSPLIGMCCFHQNLFQITVILQESKLQCCIRRGRFLLQPKRPLLILYLFIDKSNPLSSAASFKDNFTFL